MSKVYINYGFKCSQVEYFSKWIFAYILMHIDCLVSFFNHKLTPYYLFCAKICPFTWLTKANSVIQNMYLSYRWNLIFKYFIVLGIVPNWLILIIAHIFVSFLKTFFVCVCVVNISIYVCGHVPLFHATLFIVCFWDRVSLNLEFTDSIKLACNQAPGIPCLFAPTPLPTTRWAYVCVPPCLALRLCVCVPPFQALRLWVWTTIPGFLFQCWRSKLSLFLKK